MYVPYLYGSRHEFQAILRLAPLIQASNTAGKRIVPLFEPVVITRELSGKLPKLGASGLPFFLVMNPQTGKLVGKEAEVEAATFGAHGALGGAIPTYVITHNASVADVDAFLKKYRNRSVALALKETNPNLAGIVKSVNKYGNVVEYLYLGSNINPAIKASMSPNSGVLVTDGFKRAVRNADYPPSSFFSDVHLTYKALGYSGFGDYLMVGQGYKPGGGQAIAVALHLCELEKNIMVMKHFVSTRTTGIGVDIEGKFLEALDKLVSYITIPKRKFAYSTACDGFIDLAARQHYPQLGIPKELSMMQHIELVANEIL